MSGERSLWLQHGFRRHNLPLLDTAVNFVSLINMVTESLPWLWQPHQVSRARVRLSWRTLRSVSDVDSLKCAGSSCCGLSWRLEVCSTALPSSALTSEKEIWAGEIEGLLLVYLGTCACPVPPTSVRSVYMMMMMCEWVSEWMNEWVSTSCFFRKISLSYDIPSRRDISYNDTRFRWEFHRNSFSHAVNTRLKSLYGSLHTFQPTAPQFPPFIKVHMLQQQ